jgi:hypothetical protein
MTQQGAWIAYSGTARITLAIVLLLVAAAALLAATRLRHGIQLRRPSQRIRATLLASWGVALVAFLGCFAVIVQLVVDDHLKTTRPSDPVTPVTFTAAVVTFAIIFAKTRGHDQPIRLAAAATGAIAAPMIFEFPFDLIIMARTYPAIPPHPDLYRVLFFAPLFLTEFATLSLLSFSPMVRIGRAAFFSFGLMLAVFAVWALDGFAYPNAPVPFTLNVVSKIIAFVAAITLFLPQRAQASVPGKSSSTLSYAGQAAD